MQLPRRPLARRAEAVRGWALWTLPNWLASLVVVTVTAYVAAIGAAAVSLYFSPHDTDPVRAAGLVRRDYGRVDAAGRP